MVQARRFGERKHGPKCLIHMLLLTSLIFMIKARSTPCPCLARIRNDFFFFFDFARIGYYFDLALVEPLAVPSPSDARRMRIIGFRRVWFRSLFHTTPSSKNESKNRPERGGFFERNQRLTSDHDHPAATETIGRQVVKGTYQLRSRDRLEPSGCALRFVRRAAPRESDLKGEYNHKWKHSKGSSRITAPCQKAENRIRLAQFFRTTRNRRFFTFFV
jgi:hypothetical protein